MTPKPGPAGQTPSIQTLVHMFRNGSQSPVRLRLWINSYCYVQRGPKLDMNSELTELCVWKCWPSQPFRKLKQRCGGGGFGEWLCLCNNSTGFRVRAPGLGSHLWQQVGPTFLKVDSLTVRKSVPLSKPQFLHLWNEVSNTHPKGCGESQNEIRYIEALCKLYTTVQTPQEVG